MARIGKECTLVLIGERGRKAVNRQKLLINVCGAMFG